MEEALNRYFQSADERNKAEIDNKVKELQDEWREQRVAQEIEALKEPVTSEYKGESTGSIFSYRDAEGRLNQIPCKILSEVQQFGQKYYRIEVSIDGVVKNIRVHSSVVKP